MVDGDNFKGVNDSDPIELVEMADSALYRSKREGRNRVSAYRDLSSEELNTSSAAPRLSPLFLR